MLFFYSVNNKTFCTYKKCHIPLHMLLSSFYTIFNILVSKKKKMKQKPKVFKGKIVQGFIFFFYIQGVKYLLGYF